MKDKFTLKNTGLSLVTTFIALCFGLVLRTIYVVSVELHAGVTDIELLIDAARIDPQFVFSFMFTWFILTFFE